jgi:hypothetical protein
MKRKKEPVLSYLLLCLLPHCKGEGKKTIDKEEVEVKRVRRLKSRLFNGQTVQQGSHWLQVFVLILKIILCKIR